MVVASAIMAGKEKIAQKNYVLITVLIEESA